MPKPALHPVGLRRTRTGLVGGGLIILFLLQSSCDEVGRHKALTFFFDGVPPLPGTAAETESSGTKEAKPHASQPVENWRMHEPVRDCTTCHGKQPRRGATPHVELVAPVPSLCYQCHKQYAAAPGWVHGPVAAGECMLCHDPHRTKTESLLRKPIPELCFRCHEPQAVQALAGHAEPSYSHCVDCHEAHAAPTRSLLKPRFLNTPPAAPHQVEVPPHAPADSLQKAQRSLAQGSDFPSLCRTIIDYLESDQLLLAQEYLEVLRDSQLLNDLEKPTVADVLRQVRALQERESRQRAPDRAGPPDETALKAARQALAATVRTLRDYREEQERAMTALYERSVKQYRAGQLAPARAGFRQVLESGALPPALRDTARVCLEKIERGETAPPPQ